MQRQSSVIHAGTSWQLNLPPPFLTYQLPQRIPNPSCGQVAGEDDGSGLHTPVSRSRLEVNLPVTASTPAASHLLCCRCPNLGAWSLAQGHAVPTGGEKERGCPGRAQSSSLIPRQSHLSLGSVGMQYSGGFSFQFGSWTMTMALRQQK